MISHPNKLLLYIAGIIFYASQVAGQISSGGHNGPYPSPSGVTPFVEFSEIGGQHKFVLQQSTFGSPIGTAPLRPLPALSDAEASDGAMAKGIFLRWADTGDSTISFNIYRTLDYTFEKTELLGTSQSNSFIDLSAHEGLPYFYRIQAVREDLGQYGATTETLVGYQRPNPDKTAQAIVLDLKFDTIPLVDSSGNAPFISEQIVREGIVPAPQGNAFNLGFGPVAIAHYPEIDFQSNNLTTTFRYITSGKSLNKLVLRKGNFSVIANGSKLTFAVGDNEQTVSLRNKEWNQLTAIQNGSLKIYLNDDQLPVAEFSELPSPLSDEDLIIGQFSLFEARIDNLKIFDYALTEQAVRDLYQPEGDIFLDQSSIAENRPAGLFSKITSTLSDITSYKLLHDPSHAFEIKGDHLHTLIPLDYEKTPRISLTIQANFNNDAAITRELVVNVQDATEEPQDDIPAYEKTLIFGAFSDQRDSDHDGISDIQETILQTNPFDSNSGLPKLTTSTSRNLLRVSVHYSENIPFSLETTSTLEAPSSWVEATAQIQQESYNWEYQITPNTLPIFVRAKLHFNDDISAFLIDADNDGLTAFSENFLGTSDLLQDTDLDGISDLREIEMGLDPLDILDGFKPYRDTEINPYSHSRLTASALSPETPSDSILIVIPSGQYFLINPQTMKLY